MKNLTILSLFACLSIGMNAQSLSPQVIASGGDFFQAGGVSLSWTLGEPVVETVSNGAVNIILTQGFQQPEDFTIGIRSIVAADVFVNLYPNPTAQSIRMDLKYGENSRLKIELIDVLGRVLNSDNLEVTKNLVSNYQLDVSALSAGMYMFRLTDNGKLLNTYKFQKVGL